MTPTLLITGATGNIGSRLVIDLVRNAPEVRLVLLLRGQSPHLAFQRLLDIMLLQEPGLDPTQVQERVEVVCGDVSRWQLGLRDDVHQDLIGRITHVVHSAAGTSFAQQYTEAKLANSTGTTNVMALARRAARSGQLQRVIHISTAFVCGSRTGVITEDETADSGGFANAYEKTKWEAEKHVRSLMSELPVVILRPSIVVGDSQSGRIAQFNVLYPPLQAICHGLITALPCRGDAQLDIVPVDFVAAATRHFSLTTEQLDGQTFHLTAGIGSTMSVAEIIAQTLAIARKYGMGGRGHSTTFVPTPASGDPTATNSGRLGRMISLYQPYLNQPQAFDCSRAGEFLAMAGITPPNIRDYLHVIVRYALTSKWGRSHRVAA